MKTRELSLNLELWHDKWCESFEPAYFVDVARILDTEINRPEVREWIEASPMPKAQYVQLRHLLLVLRKSKVTAPRRLTWLERITGRIQA